MQSIVQARHLEKHFARFTAVKDVSFTIPRGRCFGFLGPNGAGKTTILRILHGLSPATGGQLTVFDLDIQQQAREIRRRIGVVPQQDNLDPDFTVRENLQIYASYCHELWGTCTLSAGIGLWAGLSIQSRPCPR